ncbi:MAG: 50S ribosomal protein L24 [Caldisericaceae bacterium]|nr:50S ribosomal protein L24 [Caldisericaceae bacterium]
MKVLKKKVKPLEIKKGDTVIVISGKDKGIKGKVIRTIPEKGMVVVEGVNMQTHFLRPTQDMPQGKITKREGPIYASKVQLICPHCHERTRIAHKILENGKSVRVCKNCHEVIDKI